MPLKELEKRWNNRIDGIHYLVDSKEYLPFNNEYGFKRWVYLLQKLSLYTHGVTLNIINDQLYLLGRGITHKERVESLIEDVSILINKSKCIFKDFERNVILSSKDDPKTFDGSGLKLATSDRKAPSRDTIMTL